METTQPTFRRAKLSVLVQHKRKKKPIAASMFEDIVAHHTNRYLNGSIDHEELTRILEAWVQIGINPIGSARLWAAQAEASMKALLTA